ncbi:MAG: CDP-glycerol glycerophosphotransferase family protein [Clostridia bacterium]|nr:CDP-glycerol glycerophosphotransferase family protein [Clostridia bacterium]
MEKNEDMEIVGQEYPFLFSVVIPVYNVEMYLAETLDSVIGQTIGFENIQIILVNDGSPDNSEEICLRYRDRYPDNITYVRQENAGVSAARNNGIGYIKGKYVNFLDSDDCWDKNAFKWVYAFFEKNYDQVDVVGARKKFFDAASGYHHLDYKFSSTRVIDLIANYEMIQMDVTGAFIKAEAIGEHRFSQHLKYGEDAQFINSILLDKCKLGVVKGAVHRYRKRKDESSALQNELRSESYYFDSPVYFHLDLIEQSKKKYNRVMEFIQYTVMYDMRWRIAKQLEGFLSQEDMDRYREMINRILVNISDRIICMQKNMGIGQKIYALNIKYKRNICSDFEYDHGKLLFNNICVINLFDQKNLLTADFLYIKNGMLHIEGRDNILLDLKDYTIQARVDDVLYDPVRFHTEKYDVNILGMKAYEGKGVSFEVPIKEDIETNVEFIMTFRGEFVTRLYVSPGKFAHIPSKSGNAGYCITNGRFIRIRDKVIKVTPFTKRLESRYEEEYRGYLEKSKRSYLIKWRMLYRLFKRFYKNVWLISDRPNKAGDNGEHLFRYICEHKPKGVRPYFVIQKSSEDYAKMKKIGKVVDFDSVKYRLMMLFAKMVISSQASDYVLNPFGGDYAYMSDLYDYKFVFLQHGITKDDISGWLNRFNKNISIFVTAGKPEYQSILDGDYFYDENVVKLTGFPRFDHLTRMGKNVKKKVLVIPTWRKTLSKCVDPRTDTSVYYDKFKESDFFAFYNGLINHPRLLECMRRKGYEGLFCLHPLFTEQYVDFTENDVFSVNKGYVDYQKQFAECALLVTDFSSVFFDFGYLKKPVVYSQFDKDEFFAGHSYSEGYFSYEDNGFGPVCRDLESTVDALVKEIENDCRNDPKYIKRIEEFYPFFDDKSCERVYNSICELAGENE